MTDRYGQIQLPSQITVHSDEIVELEIERGLPVKAVVRKWYTNDLDVVLVLVDQCAAAGVVVVKSCWINERGDKHKKRSELNRLVEEGRIHS